MPLKSHVSGSEKCTSTIELGTEAYAGHCLDHIGVCRNDHEIHPRFVSKQHVNQLCPYYDVNHGDLRDALHVFVVCIITNSTIVQYPTNTPTIIAISKKQSPHGYCKDSIGRFVAWLEPGKQDPSRPALDSGLQTA
jgi:hypothetical protein